MKITGTVRGFRNYTPLQLEQMQKDLSVQLSPAGLSLCVSYYRTAGRDPYIEELKLLGLYEAHQKSLPLHTAPVKLFINDTACAQTYADLMQKRKELYPHATRPSTYAELLSVCTAYLKRAGKPQPLGSQSSVLTLSATRKDAISVSSSIFAMRQTKQKSNVPAAERDILLLLFTPALYGAPFRTASWAHLTNVPHVAPLIKDICRIGEEGLLYSVLSMHDGAIIDLQKLSRTGEELPLSKLVSGYCDHLLLRVAPENCEAVCRAAYTCGIAARPFAQLVAGTNVTLQYENTTLLTLASDFLRALTATSPAEVVLPQETGNAVAAIDHTPIDTTNCKYLASSKKKVLPQVIQQNGTATAVACTAVANDFFLNALDCALVPVLTLAAKGCDFSTQAQSLGLELPASTAANGAVLSSLLGLYRVQAELGIPMSAVSSCTSDASDTLRMTVFSTAKERTSYPADAFTAAGNKVYCLMPTFKEDGLPDFSELRKLLSWLSAKAACGVLKSVRILSHAELSDALHEMEGTVLTCKTSNVPLLTAGKIRLATLAESTEELDAPVVGTIVEKPEYVEQLPLILPTKNCLLAPTRARVVILASSRDGDAQLLADALTQNGAEVRLLSALQTDTEALAEAILTCNTLLLCNGMRLPNAPEIIFAAETLARADGYLIALGDAKFGLSLPVVHLPEGIGRAAMDQICKKIK